MDQEGGRSGRAGDDALDELLLAPAGVLEGLPDATVGSRADGRIVFANAARRGAVRLPDATSWSAARSRCCGRSGCASATRATCELYFATEHPLRFTTEA